MKRIFALLLAIVAAFVCISCAKENDTEDTKKQRSEHHQIVKEAISKLEEHWEDYYQQTKVETDGHFQIKNTRVITVKENDVDLFQDVQYIIEFELYTDYYGSAPYYDNVGINDSVVVYKSGKTEVKPNNLIKLYRQKTYTTDYSDIVESIEDCEDYYNCTKKLK